MKSFFAFLVGSALFAGAALGIGYVNGGDEALVQGGAAAGLTLVPAAITLAWILWSYRKDSSMMLLASLGASGFRMFIALGGGFYLTQTYPNQFETAFLFWLALFYLVFLALEITLLVRQQPKTDGSAKSQ